MSCLHHFPAVNLSAGWILQGLSFPICKVERVFPKYLEVVLRVQLLIASMLRVNLSCSKQQVGVASYSNFAESGEGSEWPRLGFPRPPSAYDLTDKETEAQEGEVTQLGF